MDRPQAVTTYAFPKPGKALWAVLIAMTALGIFTAFLATWVPGGERVFLWLTWKLEGPFTQVWRFVSSGLLTSPLHWSHLAFSLVGLYFLGTSLEKRWGGWRFLRFLGLSVLAGNLTVLAIAAIVPETMQGDRFHPEMTYGPTAAITAIAIAWSREFADQRVLLMFIVPVRGKMLFWATIAFCVLDLIYPVTPYEGVVAPFGGVVAGLLFGGTPSLARTAYLHLKLAVLRRRSGTLRVDDVLSPKPTRRARPGAPPLRVVSGGLEDVLRKRTPPKDKRYLN